MAEADRIFGARVASDGSVLDPSGIAVSTAADSENPAVASDGTEYLVLWEPAELGRLRGSCHRDRNGPRPTRNPDRSAVRIVAVLRGGRLRRAYLVVWQDPRRDFVSDAYMARVPSDGDVLDPDGIPATLSLSPQREPAVGWDGQNYLVVWRGAGSGGTGARGIYAGRVTPSGELLDGTGLPGLPRAEPQPGPEIAWNGMNFLVIWQGPSGGGSGAYRGVRGESDSRWTSARSERDPHLDLNAGAGRVLRSDGLRERLLRRLGRRLAPVRGPALLRPERSSIRVGS